MCLFLSDVNQTFKEKCSAWMGGTFVAFFSSRRCITVAVLWLIFGNLSRRSFPKEIQTFLSLHPIPPTPTPFFTAILTRSTKLFDCGLNNVKLRKIFTILLTFYKYWGVTYVFRNSEKHSYGKSLFWIFL